MFKIKKQFTNGLLKGLVIEETTNVKFEIGKEYKPCAGSSSYIIISIE